MGEPVTGAGQVRCALVGCGQVAEQYVHTLDASPWTRVVACVDVDPVRAAEFARRHDVPWAGTPRQFPVMAPVDLAVVLTPPAQHRVAAEHVMPYVRAVYVEKPITTTVSDGRRLIETAEDRGILLGAAPDTVSAPWFLAASRALLDGAIGEPVSVSAAMLTDGPERWHPRPEVFYTDDTGPLLDMAPYYLNTLIALLGRVTRVAGALGATRAVRRVRLGSAAGEVFTSAVATHSSSLLETRSRVPVTLTASFDVAVTRTPHLEVRGSRGTLVLPDPNWYDGTTLLRVAGEPEWVELDPPAGSAPGSRGIGAVHTARALLRHASTPPSPVRALHVLGVMAAIRQAAGQGRSVNLFDDDLRWAGHDGGVLERARQVSDGHH